MEKTITLREYIHALNVLELDKDVYVDGINGICVVGGDIALTPEGQEKFSECLDLEMLGNTVTGNDQDFAALEAYEEEDKGNGGRLVQCMVFLEALAGFCPCDDYKRWFEGETAELI